MEYKNKGMDTKNNHCKNVLVESIKRNTEKNSFLNTIFKFQFGTNKNSFFLQDIPENLFLKLYQYYYFKDNWVECKTISYKQYSLKDNNIKIYKDGFKKNTKNFLLYQEDFERNVKTNNDIMNYNKNNFDDIRFSIYKKINVVFENILTKNEKDIMYAIPSASNYIIKNIYDMTFIYSDMLSLVFRKTIDEQSDNIGFSIFLLIKILPEKLESNIDTINVCLNLPSPNLILNFINEFNLIKQENFDNITRELINKIIDKSQTLTDNILNNNVSKSDSIYTYNSVREFDFKYLPKTSLFFGYVGEVNNGKENNNDFYRKSNHNNNQQRTNNYQQRTNNYQQRSNNYQQRTNNYQQKTNNYQQRTNNYQQKTNNYQQRTNNYQKDKYKNNNIVKI